jgi:hypothetical protein
VIAITRQRCRGIIDESGGIIGSCRYRSEKGTRAQHADHLAGMAFRLPTKGRFRLRLALAELAVHACGVNKTEYSRKLPGLTMP